MALGSTQSLTEIRHYATNRQVAGTIPDGVIGIFQSHNSSGRTMALGSTQPLTEIKHYATNRQVAGSIPDGVIGIFR